MKQFVLAISSADPVLEKIGGILQKRIADRAGRTSVLLQKNGEHCLLRLTEESGNFGRIRHEDGVICIEGTSYPRLLDAVGRFLRASKYTDGVFFPSSLKGTFSPRKDICGMYFATHFYNYYHSAPLPELMEYIEGLALWGMDVLAVWFDMHHYEGMGAPDAEAMAHRLRALQKHARSIGLSTSMTMLANESFCNSPESLRAVNRLQNGYFRKMDGFYGVEICPSCEGGMDLILEYRRQMLEVFRDSEPSYVMLWPYDQGGCTCDGCAPWGSNGFLRTATAVAGLLKEQFPKVKIILSTWYFTAFHSGNAEWEGLSQAFAEGRLDFVDYIMADFPGQYPRYVLEHPLPRPLLSFNEISMYGATPWGAFGANPMPAHIWEQWNDAGQKLAGGIPYSEGIFEDLNKAIILRLFYDGQEPRQTIRDYLSYECLVPDSLLDRGVAMVFQMEQTLFRDTFAFQQWEESVRIWNPEGCPAIEATAQAIQQALPEAHQTRLRWRQIYLRAVLDGELFRSKGKITDKVMEISSKLEQLYHLQQAGRMVHPLTPAAMALNRKRVADPAWRPTPIFWWETLPTEHLEQ